MTAETDTDHGALVRSATLHASSIEELDQQSLLANLHEHNFACIRGIVEPDALRTARQRLVDTFDCANDRATTGERADEVRHNFQKLSIGRARHGGVDRPRLMRVFYNPFSDPDAFGLQDNLRRVATLRNLLGGLPLDFALDSDDGGMWTAARVHHFPTGGGFMSAHRDTVLPAMYRDQGLDGYFQPLLLMSEKGVDYQRGGGFAEIGGHEVEYEDYCELGDIVIYNGATVHGVADVDPHLPFRQDRLDGRMAGLVTLYKALGKA